MEQIDQLMCYLLPVLQKARPFQYLAQENYLEKMAYTIIGYIGDLELSEFKKVLQLVELFDYRDISMYLHSDQNQKKMIFSMVEICKDTKNIKYTNYIRYKMDYLRYQISRTDEEKRITYKMVTSMDKLLLSSVYTVYICKHQFLEDFSELLAVVNAPISNFIMHQNGYPSRNALVNANNVKFWHMPSGLPVISKKSMLSAENEQIKIETILKKLNCTKHFIGVTELGKIIQIHIVTPFVVVKEHNTIYSISPYIAGDSLEDILIKETDCFQRQKYLKHYRKIFDFFCDHGIYWGDICPRNIIVTENDNQIVYHLFDFEKTQINDKILTKEERMMLCRGPLCMEELNVLCSLEELHMCFQDYFDMSLWDSSHKNLILQCIRPELSTVTQLSGIKHPTVEQLNHLDKRIMRSRCPKWLATCNKYIYVGEFGFKAEHYLSCAGFPNARLYEHKITLILMYALEHHQFGFIEKLQELTSQLEFSFIYKEFYILINSYENTLNYDASIRAFTEDIDNLIKICMDSEGILCSI